MLSRAAAAARPLSQHLRRRPITSRLRTAPPRAAVARVDATRTPNPSHAAFDRTAARGIHSSRATASPLRGAPQPDGMSMAGTVKLYHRHVMIRTNESHLDWERRLEDDEEGLVSLYAAAVKGAEFGKFHVKVTQVEGPEDMDDDEHDIVVFPDKIEMKGLTGDDVDKVGKLLRVPTPILPSSTSLKVTPIKGTHLVVCCHVERDFRCAGCGPRLVRMLDKADHPGVTVHTSSHLGGHRFAGCVVSYPTGDWYGRVMQPDDLDAILEANGAKGTAADDDSPDIMTSAVDVARKVPHLWRGRMGVDPENQKLIAARARKWNGLTDEESEAELSGME